MLVRTNERDLPIQCQQQQQQRDAPIVGVRPDQVAHGTLVRDFLHAIQIASVIQCVNARTESTVQTENTIRHDRRHGQIIKGVGKVLPDVGVAVFSQALVVKAVDLSDLTALVVSAEDGDSRFVAHFEGHEKSDRFEGIVSAVDVVAHEQIIGLRTCSANAKKLRQIIKLTMNITANCYRRADWLNVALFP